MGHLLFDFLYVFYYIRYMKIVRKENFTFISPMKLQLYNKEKIETNSIYYVQPKIDGYRMFVSVNDKAEVNAWSINGKSLQRLIDDELLYLLGALPVGIYDGELFLDEKNAKSFDVAKKINKHKLKYTIFDYITNNLEQKIRLENLFKIEFKNPRINVITSVPLLFDETNKYHKEIYELKKEFIKKGYEGVVVKKANSIYESGKRSYNWMKIKDIKHIEMLIKGYKPPIKKTEYGVIYVKNKEINTSVKIPNLELKERFLNNNFIGRKVIIEYTELINNNLRHPRFDRFINE